MSSEATPDLLPLPDARIKSYQTDSTGRVTILHTYDESDMEAYARANVELALVESREKLAKAQRLLFAERSRNDRIEAEANDYGDHLDTVTARAERLAEALRGIHRRAMNGCSAMDCARYAYAALNLELEE